MDYNELIDDYIDKTFTIDDIVSGYAVTNVGLVRFISNKMVGPGLNLTEAEEWISDLLGLDIRLYYHWDQMTSVYTRRSYYQLVKDN